MSRKQVQDTFADDWGIESLDYEEGEINPDFATKFAGAFRDLKMWFAMVRRKK